MLKNASATALSWGVPGFESDCLTRSEDLWITAEAGGVYRLSGQEMKPKWEDMRKQPGRQ